MAMITKIQQGGATYDIGIPSGLSEEEQAQIRENIGAIGAGSTVVADGTYPEMTVGKATSDGEGNNIADTYLTLQKWLDMEYPAGGDRLYIQFPGDVTPAEKYPNTSWAIDTSMQGRTIIGSGGSYTFGATGGEATHTLKSEEMPTHSHAQNNVVANSTSAGQAVYGTGNIAGVNVGGQYGTTYGAILGTGEYGGSGPHNNMPPYIVVNFWKRTA